MFSLGCKGHFYYLFVSVVNICSTHYLTQIYGEIHPYPILILVCFRSCNEVHYFFCSPHMFKMTINNNR